MIVQKFGGSCLRGPDDIRRMVAIVRSAEQLDPKVVLSAFKGVTDQLLDLAIRAEAGKLGTSEVESMHLGLVGELPAGIRNGTLSQVRKLLGELNRKLKDVARLRRLTQEEQDDIAAYGEKLAITVAAGYFAEAGQTVVPLFGAEAGIVTDGVFGDATIIRESYASVRHRLRSVRIPLVAGFFGADREGRVTTLGRGASDYVATFIAAALGCKAILYKDVDGVMTADPKVVQEARLIPRLNYRVAMELGRYGSKVLFVKAVEPAMKAGIPIEIKNFWKLNEGTTVGPRGKGEGVASVRWSGAVRTLNPGPVRTESVHPRPCADEVSLVALVGRRSGLLQVEAAIRKAGLGSDAFRAPSGIATCVLVDSSKTVRAVKALHSLLDA